MVATALDRFGVARLSMQMTPGAEDPNAVTCGLVEDLLLLIVQLVRSGLVWTLFFCVFCLWSSARVSALCFSEVVTLGLELISDHPPLPPE